MEIPDIPSIPIITRNLLKYGRSGRFQIRITSLTSDAETLSIRGFTREGSFTFRHTTVNDGQRHQDTFQINDIPIMLTVEDNSQSVSMGSTYVIVELLLEGTTVGVLLSGLVHRVTALGWPTTTNEQPMPGRGEIVVVTGSNPAVNVEASVASASLQLWRVFAIRVRLVTDANAANRRVHFTATSAGIVVAEAFSTVDQPASTTIDYMVGRFGSTPDETDNGVILVNWPDDVWISESTDSIATATLNRQATDDFGAMSIYVEKFFRSNA